MSNQYLQLPTPAGNGAGAWVDVSTFGALKTIVVTGTASCTVTIEFNNAAVATDGSASPVFTVQDAGSETVQVAARWMRARVGAYNPNVAGTVQVHVGGTTAGAQFASLPVPSNNGVGAAVDVSGLTGPFKTVQVGGAFLGTLLVEVSEDGTTEWAQPFGFNGQPGFQNAVMIARWMRVRRLGLIASDPNPPVVNVGAALTSEGLLNTGVAISAGTELASTGTVLFSNTNGVTFGMSGSVLTASVQTAGGTATGVAISAGTQIATTGAVVFSNSNGVSFGLSNQTLTASVPVQSTGPGAVSALGGAITSGTVLLSNTATTPGNVLFGINGQTATASAVLHAQPLLLAGSTSQTAGTIAFQNANNVLFGMATGGLSVGVITASALTQNQGPAALSAGTASASSGTIVFSNSNNISFGMSGSTITATSPVGVILAGTQFASLGNVFFVNSNNVSFGMSASSNITASFSADPSGPQAISAGTASVSIGTVVFSNSNGVSFGLNGSTVTASVATAAAGGVGIAAGTQTASTGTVEFVASNGIAFGMSGSNQVTASYTQSTAPAAIAVSGSVISAGTVVFSASNGITWGVNGNTITAAYSQSTGPAAISAGTASVGSGTVVFSNSNGVSFGLSGSTVTASVAAGGVAISASGSSQSAGTIVFSNSNGVSFGMSGSTLTASFTPGGALGIGGYFGNGADGNVTISANSTLTRDMFYDSLTVNAGRVVNANGFRVFCRTALISAGAGARIIRDGAAAVNATAGVGFDATQGSMGNSSGSGENGTQNAGVQPPASGTVPNAYQPGKGGAGGASSTANAGGAGGDFATLLPDSVGGMNNLPAAQTGRLGMANNAAICGGTGGGPGGGVTGSASGGGGGAGGGYLVVAARIVTNPTQIALSARGGRGGDGGTGAGSGGGGGGGYVVHIIGGGTSASLDVSGGSPGTPGAGGVSGAAGTDGRTLLFNFG